MPALPNHNLPNNHSHLSEPAATQTRDVAEQAEFVPSTEFVQNFTRSQRRLFLVILAQVADPVEAEEILQEANLVIWKKAHLFQDGTNFLAWASQVAAYEVLKFRSRRKRSKLVFHDELLEQVATAALEQSDELERQRIALKGCLEKLRPVDRQLIEARYSVGASNAGSSEPGSQETVSSDPISNETATNGKSLAEELGRPANSVYQSLGRIRRTLWECIQRRLVSEARS